MREARVEEGRRREERVVVLFWVRKTPSSPPPHPPTQPPTASDNMLMGVSLPLDPSARKEVSMLRGRKRIAGRKEKG